jgi:hypothetical protein
MGAVDKCVPSKPAVSDAAFGTGSLLQDKIYACCFRDYVSNEELNSIMARRWGIGRLILRARRCGQLSVDSVNKGDIGDSSDQADDAIANTNSPPAIHWTSTSLRLGWNVLGKTVTNPPVSEKGDLPSGRWQWRYCRSASSW